MKQWTVTLNISDIDAPNEDAVQKIVEKLIGDACYGCNIDYVQCDGCDADVDCYDEDCDTCQRKEALE